MKALTSSLVKLSEADVTAQIVGYLRGMGWRVVRYQSMGCKNARGQWTMVGEKGAADYFAYRAVDRRNPGAVEFFWFEVKRLGRTPEPHQLAWMDREWAMGVRANWHDSLGSCMAWYRLRYGRHAGDAPGVGL